VTGDRTTAPDPPGVGRRVLSALFGADPVRRGVSSPSVEQLLGAWTAQRRSSGAGGSVWASADEADRHGAVFACKDLISRQLSTLELGRYRIERGAMDYGSPRFTPLAPVKFQESPDGEMTWDQWMRAQIVGALTDGNAWALIERVGKDGYPTSMQTVEQSAVSWSRQGTRGPFDFKLDSTPIGRWPSGRLWHMPALTIPGTIIGLSPISYAALTIGHGLATQRFGSRFFADGAIPTTVLTHPEAFGPDVAAAVKAKWAEVMAGTREPAVLTGGWEHKQITVSPEESQFLETMSANYAHVCSFFGVDPRDIGSAIPGGSSLAYSSPELDQLRLLVRTIGPWMVRFENALSRLRPRTEVYRFMPDALMRTDITTRYTAYQAALTNGWMSVNEVRAMENRPGIGPEGDRYGTPTPPPAQSPAEPEEDEPDADDPPEQPGDGEQPRSVRMMIDEAWRWEQNA
jgi:HK97 family phage portal protein